VCADEVRWGLTGTRGYAQRAALPGILGASGASLAGVAGSDADRARELAREHGAAAYASPQALFESSDIGAVWICSPSYLHVEHARAALAAGRHVLLEKPLALSAEDAWGLVRLADERGLVLATGYQARYVPGHRRMRDLIADGAIGRVTAARTFYALNRPAGPPGWRADRELARWGVLADIGTHHIDLLRMLLGEVATAAGATARQGGYATEDAATASLTMESGALASLTVTGGMYRATTVVEVFGSSGALLATDTSPDGQGDVLLLRADADPEQLATERPNAMAAQVAAVSAAIADGAVGDPASIASAGIATGADGARNLEILEAISG
jgi:1,5-anhydro-D-fructose reductase (1,5-anhydro-D-mannitol-forming)